MEYICFFLVTGILASVLVCAVGNPTGLRDYQPFAVTREPLADHIDFTAGPQRDVQPTKEEQVTTIDRFYRVYEDGTIEFKFVLSNGMAQYQKITNKVVNGKTIQVYEGYHSERLPDNTYRTTYYIADENGYRRLRREFDTKPPVLPPYVPHVPQIRTP